jgi:hypothetical protein
MTDDTVNSQEAENEIPNDISDADADKLFENGGEMPEEKAEVEDTPDPELTPSAEEKPKEEPKVNLGALHEERAKRKEVEAKVAVMEDRFKQLVNSLSQPPEQKPTPEEDPVNYFKQEIEDLKQFKKQTIEQTQAERQQEQVVNAYRAQSEQFKASTPDFNDAYNHVLTNRLKELKTMGLDEAQARHTVAQEEYNIALKSLQDGVNPAQRIYEIAALRGYQKKATAEVPKKDLSVIEKGQKNAKVSASATPEGELSLEALAEMDDEEFAAAWAKLKKQNEK